MSDQVEDREGQYLAADARSAVADVSSVRTAMQYRFSEFLSV